MREILSSSAQASYFLTGLNFPPDMFCSYASSCASFFSACLASSTLCFTFSNFSESLIILMGVPWDFSFLVLLKKLRKNEEAIFAKKTITNKPRARKIISKILFSPASKIDFPVIPLFSFSVSFFYSVLFAVSVAVASADAVPVEVVSLTTWVVFWASFTLSSNIWISNSCPAWTEKSFSIAL